VALSLDALRRRLLEQAEQDAQFDRSERDLTLGLQRGESNTLLADQRDESDYNRSVYDLGRQRDETLTHSDENMADQGILRSGANLVSRGRIGEEYGRNSEALARRLSTGKEDRARQLQQMREDTQRRLDELKLDKARVTTDREQQKAIDEAESSAAQVAAQAEQARQQQEEAARVAAAQPQYTPTGQYLPPDPTESGGWEDWESQNSRKATGESMPEWQRMGFPSYESWAAVYRRFNS
jgi:hypothetical protein